MDNWDDVRFFLAVARCGNVTGAARMLGVNHSTVSRRIMSFEQSQGVRLFERLASGYELTQEGGDILDIAMQLEEKNHDLARRLQGRDSRMTGEIRLTMPHDIFDYLMVEHVAQFVKTYPDIEVQLQVAKGLKNLHAREADIAIRLTDSPPEYLVGKEVCKLQHAIYGQESLPSQRTPIITWLGEKGIPTWAQGFKNPYIVIQVDDLSSMYMAVSRGLGIARMPCFIHNLIGDPKVLPLDRSLPLSTWGVWVLSHVDLRKTARVKACREFLTEKLQAQRHLFIDA